MKLVPKLIGLLELLFGSNSHVAPIIVPLFSFPLISVSTEPEPSLKSQFPIKPSVLVKSDELCKAETDDSSKATLHALILSMDPL